MAPKEKSHEFERCELDRQEAESALQELGQTKKRSFSCRHSSTRIRSSHALMMTESRSTRVVTVRPAKRQQFYECSAILGYVNATSPPRSGVTCLPNAEGRSFCDEKRRKKRRLFIFMIQKLREFPGSRPGRRLRARAGDRP